MLVAVFFISTQRNAESAKTLLGEFFKGFLITDRWGAYNWLPVLQRQFCWAHLLRDFIKISMRSGAPGRIGESLLSCVKRMFRLWGLVRDGTISHAQFRKSMAPIQCAIEKLLLEGTQCADKKTANTCRNLLKHPASLWTFVEHEGIEPTNNYAEQLIRHYVIWRKNCYGTQSKRGNQFVERILTTTTTCRLQQRCSLEFITEAVKAYLSGTAPPSLLPKQQRDEDSSPEKLDNTA